MNIRKIGDDAKKAIQIGSVCIASYLACYYLRNILGVVTPEMLKSDLFTKEFIGVLSSVYFLVYAAGQMVNGILGDILNPKKMVVYGLGLSGFFTLLFPFIKLKELQVLCFAVIGFGLSMLRGPLVKTFSENTVPDYARIIAVFFSYSSFAGTLIASLLSIIFNWKWTFIIAGLLSLLIAVCAYIIFSLMERKGIITYSSSKNKAIHSVAAVFRIEKFVFYMVIGGIVEIAGASISFWIPTYMTEYMGFASEIAAVIYSGISFIRSFTPFIALCLYKRMENDDIKMIRATFLIASICFLILIFVHNPYINIVFLLLALMAVGCSSALLWSIYIPGLGKTGMVSSVNGILDCSGYIFAAFANIIFANVIERISWTCVIMVWAILAGIGVSVTFMKSITTCK